METPDESPEEFLKRPLDKSVIQSNAVDFLVQNNFRFSARFFYDWDDEEDREPYLEEGAWVKEIYTPHSLGHVAVALSRENKDISLPSCRVDVTDIEGKHIANYVENVTLQDAAYAAVDIANKLAERAAEIVGRRIYMQRPLESMKKVTAKQMFTEGRHKPGCDCGFCRNIGRGFGNKKKDKPTETAASKKVEENLGTVRGTAYYYDTTPVPFKAKYMNSEYGWWILIYDYSPETWGRAESGVGTGPVIEQGWLRDLERRGWKFPELPQPENIKDQVLKRMRELLKKHDTNESKSSALASFLLEDDIPGGRAPDNHQWGYIDKDQLAIGTKVEMEHTDDPGVAEEIAADHLTEDPEYYTKLKGAGLADEMPRAKGCFYPSAGGPSSV